MLACNSFLLKYLTIFKFSLKPLLDMSYRNSGYGVLIYCIQNEFFLKVIWTPIETHYSAPSSHISHPALQAGRGEGDCTQTLQSRDEHQGCSPVLWLILTNYTQHRVTVHRNPLHQFEDTFYFFIFQLVRKIPDFLFFGTLDIITILNYAHIGEDRVSPGLRVRQCNSKKFVSKTKVSR